MAARPRFARFVVDVVVALALVAGPAAARGEERRTMTLDYTVGEGAEGCPTNAELRARLTEEVGYDPIVASGGTITATLEITSDTRGFHGRYTTDGRSGHAVRDLSSEISCDDLVSSFVLSAAISLDPEPTPPTPTKAAQETVVVSVPVPVYIDRPVVVPSAPRATPPVRVTFHAGYAVGSGLVPDVAHGPLAYVGLRGAGWEVGLEGAYLFEGDASSKYGDVLVSAAFASVVPCFAPALSERLTFFGCGHLSLGGGFVDAARVDSPTPSTVLVSLLGVRTGVGLRIAGPLEGRLFGDLLADLTPIEATLRDRGVDHPVFTSASVLGRGVLALALVVP